MSERSESLNDVINELTINDLMDLGFDDKWVNFAKTHGILILIEILKVLQTSDSEKLRAIKSVSHKKIHRFCRNKFVKNLHQKNVKTAEIRRLVLSEFGEEISVRRVQEIIKKL